MGCERCPLVDVVVIVAADETTIESVFDDDWVTGVEECELVMMLLFEDVLTVFVCC